MRRRQVNAEGRGQGTAQGIQIAAVLVPGPTITADCGAFPQRHHFSNLRCFVGQNIHKVEPAR